MKSELKNICDLINEKISANELINKNLASTYISTESMLPNKRGITKPSSIPNKGTVTAYKKDDVLVSNIRPYFKKIWLAKYEGVCSNDILVFRAKNTAEANFLYYVLADDDFFVYSMATSKGTKMPRGDKASIMRYEVESFDLNTQKKIASILKPIDGKIELNTAINNNFALYLLIICVCIHLHIQMKRIYVSLYIIYQYLTLVFMMEVPCTLKVNLARHQFR